MMLSGIHFMIGFLAASTTAISVSNSDRPTATIDSGVVIGTTTSVSSSPFTIEQFLGIPFAAAPVRFKPPRNPIPWSSPFDASTYKPSCFQQFDYPEEIHKKMIEWANTPGPPAGESEDCLNLNVFIPEGGTKGKAVLFWIHGGAFSYGSGSLPVYRGSSFAANHDVVVVTINYRTNIFGFPGSPDLPEKEKNLGLLDQRLALDWVQRNIASFNGDPKRVTIFGESAGAGSVEMLITSPPDPVPFHAAILQSGGKTLNRPFTGSQAAESWAKLVNATGCPQDQALECIRGKPASRLKEIVEQEALPFDAIPDDFTLTKTPRQNRLKSKDDPSLVARVPVLFGSNGNEGSMYVIGQNDTATFLHQALRVLYPNRLSTEGEKKMVQEILDWYPLGQSGMLTEKDRIHRIVTDVLGQCPTKVTAEESQSVDIPTYRYYFTASFPNSEIFKTSGSHHSAEIEMIFGTYQKQGASEFQREVSRKMQKAWADFAKEPSTGPGWAMVPQVGVFGGSLRSEDQIGWRTVFELADGELDRRCILWEDLFTMVGGM